MKNRIIKAVFIWPIKMFFSLKCFFYFKKKTKESNVLKNFFDKFYKIRFPDGEKQILEQTNEIVKLSNGKLNFKKAKSVLLRSSIIFFVDRSYVYDYIKENWGDILNENELKAVAAFIVFGSVNESTIKLVEFGFNTENFGCNEDKIPTGYGEFGRCSTNPIPVNGIIANEVYLGKLRTVDDKKIRWERKASVEPKIEGIVGVIDLYDIFDEDNKYFGELYISSYNQKLSEKVPAGFIIYE